LFELGNEITGRIANSLGVALIRTEAARPTDNPDARDYILRARAVNYKGPSRANHADAIGLYEQALALDPNSWEAQARLASQLINRVGDGFVDTEAADTARATELIRQAQAAAPREQVVRYATGQLFRGRGRYEEAITEYEAVLAINPNSAWAFAHIGRCKYRLGLLAESIPLQEQAIRLSPRDPEIFTFYFRIGEAHLLQAHIDEAISWLEKARGANPTVPYVHLWLASAYGLQGRLESAAAEFAEARRLIGDESYSSIARVARPRIRREPKLQPFYEATLYAGLRKAGVPEE
jgi:tetratricopeptide (TPR) repeat protein